MTFMKYVIHMLFILTTVFAASCSRTGIVSDVPVKFVRPEVTVSQPCDTAFNCLFPEVGRSYDLQIVDDTVLVVSDQIKDSGQYRFKAYSLNTFKYLGSFIRNGRGPGEMIDPRLLGGNPPRACVGVDDISQAYIVDVEKSIESGHTAIVRKYDLPSNNLLWIPMPDDGQFVMMLENKKTVFHAIKSDGTISQTFDLYKQARGEQYLTHLSSIMTNDGCSGNVAEFMLLFPQFNIMDTESGQVRSFAVDAAYRKWKAVLNKRIWKDNIEYYTGLTSTQDYIFATYKGVPISSTNAKDQGTSIHIFDWNGHFLYDINVTENIDNMAFDNHTGYLYCHERIEDRIVRYDLSYLL